MDGKRLILTLFFFLLAKFAFGQLSYTYTDPCTGIQNTVTVSSQAGTVVMFYAGQYQTFTLLELQSGGYETWVASVNAAAPPGSNPCAGNAGAVSGTTSASVGTNVTNTVATVTGALATLGGTTTTSSGGMDVGGSIGGGSTSSGSSSNGNSSSNDQGNNDSGSSGGSSSDNDSGSSSSGSSSDGGSSTGGSTSGSSGSGSSGSSDSGGSSGGSTGGSGSGGSGDGGSTGGGSTDTGGGTGGSGGGTSGSGSSNNSEGSGGVDGTGSANTDGGGDDSNSGGSIGEQDIESSSGGESESSSEDSGGSGGGKKKKGPRARKGSLIASGDMVLIRNGSDYRQGGNDNFKINAGMTYANTKQTLAAGALLNYTTGQNEFVLTGYGSWKVDQSMIVGSNSILYNVEQSTWFNTGNIMYAYKQTGYMTVLYGTNFSFGQLGDEGFSNWSAQMGVFTTFNGWKGYSMNFMGIGMYSPYTFFYEGQWFKGGFLLVPLTSIDISITNTFKLNVSTSTVMLQGQGILNFQLMTGAKMLL